MNQEYKALFDELLKINIKSANEVYYALSLLDTALSDSTEAFKESVNDLVENNKFEEAQQLINCCTNNEKLSNEINSILNYVSEKVIKSGVVNAKDGKSKEIEEQRIQLLKQTDMSVFLLTIQNMRQTDLNATHSTRILCTKRFVHLS